MVVYVFDSVVCLAPTDPQKCALGVLLCVHIGTSEPAEQRNTNSYTDTLTTQLCGAVFFCIKHSIFNPDYACKTMASIACCFLIISRSLSSCKRLMACQF